MYIPFHSPCPSRENIPPSTHHWNSSVYDSHKNLPNVTAQFVAFKCHSPPSSSQKVNKFSRKLSDKNGFKKSYTIILKLRQMLQLIRMPDCYDFTCSWMNCSTWDTSPVRPEDSATITLLTHWEKVNASPGTPRVYSLVTSAVEMAVLDVRSLSLRNKGKQIRVMWWN